MTRYRFLTIFVVLITSLAIATNAIWAAEFPTADPQEVGLDAERFARIAPAQRAGSGSRQLDVSRSVWLTGACG